MNFRKIVSSILIGSTIILVNSSPLLANIVIDNGNNQNYGISLNNYDTNSRSINNETNSIEQNTTKTKEDNTENNSYNPYYKNYGYSLSGYKYGNNEYSLSDAVTYNSSIPETNEYDKVNESNNTTITNEEKKLLELINKDRREAGLKPLKISNKLFNIADIKSKDMYDYNYFSHTSPNFGRTYSLIRKEGIDYIRSGENIGKTYSVYRAHNGFMQSSGHRENIMNPNFTHIGIGIYGNYYTEVFIEKR